MAEVSNKQKTYAEKIKENKHLVALWFDEDKWQQIKKAADSVQEPVTTWIRRAAFTALRRWEVPEAKKLYDPCSICGIRHDKSEHFKDE